MLETSLTVRKHPEPPGGPRSVCDVPITNVDILLGSWFIESLRLSVGEPAVAAVVAL